MEDFQTDLRSSQFSTSKGISWITASLFLIADMAGGGVVALPIAMLNTGLIVGTLSLILIGSAFCYTAHLLGECWLTMCRRWPEAYGSTHCRKPYPEIAYRAMGERARFFMSCTLNVLLFAVATVYLLLGSTIINELWASLFPAYAIGKCLMILIMAVAIYPVTLLKSPKNFWWAVVTAMLTTTISVALILVGSTLDSSECANFARQPPFRPVNYFLSSGVFFFAFGGHGVFPTIQHDMRQPKMFTRSSIVAFLVVGTMYLPLSYLGYFVYGDSLQDSIISSIQTNFIQQFANLFIGIHCILTMTLIFNPLNQEVEHLLNISHHFCWQRVLIRTSMMAAIIFVALTVPNFGPILDLIGGTGVALTAAILPCTFYLFMHAADEIPSIQCWKTMNMDNVDNLASKFDGPIIFEIPNLKKVFERTPTLILAINFSVIAIAIICGIAATYVAIGELSDSKFDGPCYLRLASDKFVVKTAAMHCCGTGRNISRHPEFICPIFQ